MKLYVKKSRVFGFTNNFELFQVFVAQLKAKGTQFPVALFCDNHSSHYNSEIIELCVKLGVILIGLHPNSTFCTQPCDNLFGALKESFADTLYSKRVSHFLRGDVFILSHLNFAAILKETLEKSVKETAIKHAFKVTGIFPFEANNVDYSGLRTTTPQKDTIHNGPDIIEDEAPGSSEIFFENEVTLANDEFGSAHNESSENSAEFNNENVDHYYSDDNFMNESLLECPIYEENHQKCDSASQEEIDSLNGSRSEIEVTETSQSEGTKTHKAKNSKISVDFSKLEELDGLDSCPKQCKSVIFEFLQKFNEQDQSNKRIIPQIGFKRFRS